VPETPRQLAEHVCIRNMYPSGAKYPWEFERKGEKMAFNPTRPNLPVGETRADTLFFYGGIELWEARIDGVTAIVGVAWPFKSQPRDGTSMLCSTC
jgi:hypothetical protein